MRSQSAPGSRRVPRFRVKVEREPLGRLAVVILQRSVRWEGEAVHVRFEPVARAAGAHLAAVTPLLAAVLRANGTSPERLGRPSRPEDLPIDLDGPNGARVALALFAVRPLRKPLRLAGVARGIAGMSPEEVLYWFARLRRGPQPRVLRALRILLSAE